MDQFCLDREEEEEKGLDDYIDLTNFYLRILFNYREKEGSIEGTELNISWWFLLLSEEYLSEYRYWNLEFILFDMIILIFQLSWNVIVFLIF